MYEIQARATHTRMQNGFRGRHAQAPSSFIDEKNLSSAGFLLINRHRVNTQ